ncbi:MAG: hypothetical protein FD166_1986 [Bacteroidetes bacterium]|nr:MAG: hypothetical protein FD166_1986 [Bacteroidota bacterium]
MITTQEKHNFLEKYPEKCVRKVICLMHYRNYSCEFFIVKSPAISALKSGSGYCRLIAC